MGYSGDVGLPGVNPHLVTCDGRPSRLLHVSKAERRSRVPADMRSQGPKQWRDVTSWNHRVQGRTKCSNATRGPRLSRRRARGIGGSALRPPPMLNRPIRSRSRSRTGRPSRSTPRSPAHPGEDGLQHRVGADEYLAQIPAIEDGDIHFIAGNLVHHGGRAVQGAVAGGKAIDLGETGMQAIEEWWYPAYMKEKCPGLPDWKALNDCAKLFATAETGDEGQVCRWPAILGRLRRGACRGARPQLGSGPSRQRRDDQRRNQVGLRAQGAGDGLGLRAELDVERLQRRVGEVPGLRPTHATTTRSGALNPDKTHDCGKPQGPIKKLGNEEARDEVSQGLLRCWRSSR